MVASRKRQEVPLKELTQPSAYHHPRSDAGRPCSKMANLQREQEAVGPFCAAKIAGIGLPMRLLRADIPSTGPRIVFFFFYAEGRGRFPRELVKDLASTFGHASNYNQVGA